MQNESVFREQFDRFSPGVFSYFALCFDRETAYDLTQQVFLNVWKNMRKNGSAVPGNWKAWIFGIAVNVKNDFLREKYRRLDTTGFEANISYAEDDDADLRVILEKAFSALKTDERELLILKTYGFDSRDIGELLGISASTVRSRLSAARKRFMNILKDYGVEI